MKTKLLALGLALVSVSLFAQGKVGFVNDSARLFMMGPGVLGPDVAYAGQPIPTAGLPSGGLSAILYAGTSAGSLSLQTAIPLTGTSIPAAGRMATKNVVLAGVPGGAPAYFEIILVSTTASLPNSIVGGAYNATIFTGAVYFSTSGLFTFSPGASVTYPVIYSGTSTWDAHPIVLNVPEPSVLALTGIFGALLAVHRRRRVEYKVGPMY